MGPWNPNASTQVGAEAGLSSARRLLDAAVPESDLLEQVRQLAEIRGWRVYHALDSRGSTPGFPVLCMVRGDRLEFAELKTEKGTGTQAQQEWLDELAAVTRVEAHLWRPSNWAEIEEVLR